MNTSHTAPPPRRRGPSPAQTTLSCSCVSFVLEIEAPPFEDVDKDDQPCPLNLCL
jgi:hypothetical protein